MTLFNSVLFPFSVLLHLSESFCHSAICALWLLWLAIGLQRTSLVFISTYSRTAPLKAKNCWRELTRVISFVIRKSNLSGSLLICYTLSLHVVSSIQQSLPTLLIEDEGLTAFRLLAQVGELRCILRNINHLISRILF